MCAVLVSGRVLESGQCFLGGFRVGVIGQSFGKWEALGEGSVFLRLDRVLKSEEGFGDG